MCSVFTIQFEEWKERNTTRGANFLLEKFRVVYFVKKFQGLYLTRRLIYRVHYIIHYTTLCH
jgi:hypothetical protein